MKVRESFLCFLYILQLLSTSSIGTKETMYKPITTTRLLMLSSNQSSKNMALSIFVSFSLDIWDPFDGLSPFNTTTKHPFDNVPSSASVWKETPETHVLEADLSGIEKEVKVEVEEEEGRILLISGKHEKRNDKWRGSGKFYRRFRLPESAKMDEIKASIKNGVLTVTVPKKDLKKPEVNSMDISG